MTGFLAGSIVIPLGLGLIGFVEPCSIGSTLVMVKALEGKSAAGKVAQMGVFAVTRAVLIGLLGMFAAVLGAAFFSFQRTGWFLLGTV